MTGKSQRPASARSVQAEFRLLGDEDIAEHSARFFKTGKGEYGEGDRFLGIRVPVTRTVAKKYQALPMRSVRALLRSPYHEERLLAVLILVRQFERGDADEKQLVFDTYVAMRRFVNNWDLVDSSAHKIVGPGLEDRDRGLLYDLSASDVLWDRRIAIMSTLHFINNDDFSDTLSIAERLIADREDLIHKAVGWMLREVGNRDREAEEAFLRRHYRVMPRTMLRYAIEKFPEPRRKAYLDGKIR